MKLNLGCGGKPYPRDQGWINHDKSKHSNYVDLSWDLSVFPWYDDKGCSNDVVRTPLVGVFEVVEARDVLEHLPPDKFFPFFDSCWDLLVPNGQLRIQVPQQGSENALLDPTHWRGFVLGSFDILDPRTKFGKHNFWYTQKKWHIQEKYVVPRSRVNLFIRLQKCTT